MMPDTPNLAIALLQAAGVNPDDKTKLGQPLPENTIANLLVLARLFNAANMDTNTPAVRQEAFRAVCGIQVSLGQSVPNTTIPHSFNDANAQKRYALDDYFVNTVLTDPNGSPAAISTHAQAIMKIAYGS